MSLIAKVHKKDNHTIVAVCDKALFGKLLEENDKRLDLRGDFFNGDERLVSEVGDLIRNADGVNLVGSEAVKLGVEEGVIVDDNIRKIADVPYAQAVLLHD
ncbi:hypothetical protein COV18_01880 [Candidatus Woesearchaeota archaeon CG10_big_fil_rev_8_21_14_0_10_37_12]|nr:MAG: hypothetical protein COV18_01880 [Candidatus Woesearchaeota archaeon CG10_big_fil_rev_8_21_14_0_10_37_12]